MNLPDNIPLHLRCIESDLRNYLMDPSDFTSDYIEDIHVLLLDVMYRLGVTPESEEGEDDADTL